jgi:hypothetical protein
MNSKRLYYILLASIVLLGAMGVGGVVYGDSLLKQKNERLLELKVQSITLEQQQQALIQAKKDIEKYTELEIIAKSIVPQEKDQARTVREIIQIAEESGIKIGAITFPSSTLGQAAAKPTTAASAEGGSAPTTAATPATTQVKAVEGIAGLYQMEVNVQGLSNDRVTYQRFISFLKNLEQSRRTSQVNNLTITPDSTDRNLVTFSLIINVYLKP